MPSSAAPRPTDDPPPPTARHDNIVLTGFMGTGKSTVAHLVAARTGRRAVDTDDIIERRHGPIPELFAVRGEARFRELERALAAELASTDGLVISTGGRMLLDPANAVALQATGHVFCLTATVDELVARLRPGAAARPLLAGADLRATIIRLLAERAEGYARFEQVDTTGRTPGEVADDIVGRLQYGF